MEKDPEMCREAIVEGRTGLNEMADGDLEDFALDCWNVDAADMCDQCGEPNDDGEGEDGLCGNCADKRYNEDGERVVAPE